MKKVRRWLAVAGLYSALSLGLVGHAAHAAVPSAPAPLSDAATQELLLKVRQQLKDAPVVRGQFEQLKTVKGFKQPLKSAGDFVLAREKGIVWHVLKPFESTLIVKPDSLQSRRADGEVSMQMRAEDEPVLRTVNAMLFAVMTADLVQLKQYFQISGKAQATGWQLHLVPRDAVLAQWLASVEVQGAQFVQFVQLQEARGDSSEIRIQGASAEQKLSDADAALFR